MHHGNEETALGRASGRRVGIEIEFGGLDTLDAARVIHDHAGGCLDAESPHLAVVRDTAFGDVKIELDWAFAHASVDHGGVIDKTRDMVTKVGNQVVPTEVVFPPIDGARISEVDRLIRRLDGAGAEGTRAGLLNGFGLHLNPELWEADLTAPALTRVLQAYLIRSPNLRQAIAVDLTRNLLPFVEPFGTDYAELVLDPDYRPTLTALIEGYIQHNPTRNRELDLLPIFAHIDTGLVHKRLDDPKISPRPTFHWRLPNSDLENPAWSIAGMWQHWLGVERLALDSDRLLAAIADWRRQPISGLPG